MDLLLERAGFFVCKRKTKRIEKLLEKNQIKQK